jgi:hypothetical protein
MLQYPIPCRDAGDIFDIHEPIRSVLTIGHGDIAARQRPIFEHWLAQGVTVHCADIDESKLDDCLDGIHRYVLPRDEQRLTRVLYAAPADLLVINNVPELHLITALQWSTYVRRIIIQKPQDLNYPLIKTMARAQGYERFRRQAVIHDHYRNKDVVPALAQALPSLHKERGQFKRLLFILTEGKSVNDELHRSSSLCSGMIQDLAVHMVDLFLEVIHVGAEWHVRDRDERKIKRVGGTIEVVACHKLREMASSLGNLVETFAAIDLHVKEQLEFPTGHPAARLWYNEFDVLIVVGKGLSIEQGVAGDIKTVAVEFEREGEYDAWIDLKSLSVHGFQNHLPQGGAEINRNHGGLNRPYFLISPNPPEHAIRGLGGSEYAQWQTLGLGQHVAENIQMAVEKGTTSSMGAYPYGRSLGDLLRELATQTRAIRPIWGDLGSLTRYLSAQPLPKEFYD